MYVRAWADRTSPEGERSGACKLFASFRSVRGRAHRKRGGHPAPPRPSCDSVARTENSSNLTEKLGKATAVRFRCRRTRSRLTLSICSRRLESIRLNRISQPSRPGPARPGGRALWPRSASRRFVVCSICRVAGVVSSAVSFLA